MKAIVFGGAGFLGSHVAETLSQAGHRVVVFDAQPSAYLGPNQEGVVGDILNADQVAAAIKGCNVVYNFAGIADIEEANTRPLDTVRVNVLGNTILLEAAAREKVQRFVFASSLYVYSESGAFYRSSKQACELLIDNYRQAFGLSHTILRYGSLGFSKRLSRRDESSTTAMGRRFENTLMFGTLRGTVYPSCRKSMKTSTSSLAAIKLSGAGIC